MTRSSTAPSKGASNAPSNQSATSPAGRPSRSFVMTASQRALALAKAASCAVLLPMFMRVMSKPGAAAGALVGAFVGAFVGRGVGGGVARPWDGAGVGAGVASPGSSACPHASHVTGHMRAALPRPQRDSGLLPTHLHFWSAESSLSVSTQVPGLSVQEQVPQVTGQRASAVGCARHLATQSPYIQAQSAGSWPSLSTTAPASSAQVAGVLQVSGQLARADGNLEQRSGQLLRTQAQDFLAVRLRPTFRTTFVPVES
mmetsp:Transcript_3549/g.10467  ORF Transcript_3549/g.10467 Transcript_3549/m.10467 type:complete len:257 (-) Transcript_3549:138-908(-)